MTTRRKIIDEAPAASNVIPFTPRSAPPSCGRRMQIRALIADIHALLDQRDAARAAGAVVTNMPWLEVRHDHRRALMGQIAGISAASVVPVPGIAAPHPDAAFLAACDAFNVADATVRHLDAFGEDDERGDDVIAAAVKARYAALDAVSDLAPQTPAGLQAKARIARDLLAHSLKEDRAEPKGAREEFLALAVLREVTQQGKAGDG